MESSANFEAMAPVEQVNESPNAPITEMSATNREVSKTKVITTEDLSSQDENNINSFTLRSQGMLHLNAFEIEFATYESGIHNVCS
jgi:hypothetical protein